MTAHSETEHAEHHAHYTPTVVLWKVFIALLVFLVLTVAAAGVDLTHVLPVHIPGANIIVMLLIAVIKAALVVLYFMEVKKGTKLTWLWAAAGFIWFLTMIGIMGDYLTRNWITVFGW